MHFIAATAICLLGSAIAAPSAASPLVDRTIAYPECVAACTLFCLTHGDAPCFAICLTACAASVQPGEPIENIETNEKGLSFKTGKGDIQSNAKVE